MILGKTPRVIILTTVILLILLNATMVLQAYAPLKPPKPHPIPHPNGKDCLTCKPKIVEPGKNCLNCAKPVGPKPIEKKPAYNMQHRQELQDVTSKNILDINNDLFTSLQTGIIVTTPNLISNK